MDFCTASKAPPFGASPARHSRENGNPAPKPTIHTIICLGPETNIGFLHSLCVASSYAIISRRRRQKKAAVLRFTPQDWQWFLLSILPQNAQLNGLVYTGLNGSFRILLMITPFLSHLGQPQYLIRTQDKYE